jgi:DNA-binding NtrC family response regulator
MKRNLRVMVIDDENIVGKRLKPALEKNGDIVETFTDARQALERFSEQHFDIVVSDIRMDDIDGLEVLEQVVARSDRTKVIIITGYATVEVAQEALVKGAFDFIAKPFKLSDLGAVVNKAASSLGFSNIMAIKKAS